MTVEQDILLENSSQLGVFWPKGGLQANHGTVRKKGNIPATTQSETAYMKQYCLCQ